VLPGVVADAETDVLGKNPAMTMQGVRNKYQTYSVDGSFMNDSGDQHQVYFPTNMEAISEVKVLMTNYQAEYGRSGGAIVNAVTKSGTQQFHGSAYVYKRHEQFNANGYFNNLNRLAKPRYRYATAGFTIGGPAYWPGKFNSNRGKLFFFFSSETLRGVSPQAIRQLTVPTELERAGNFSQTLELSGKAVVIRDPTTGDPFPGAVIPPVRLNTNGQKLLGVFPLPNQLDRSVTKGNYNYVFQESYFSPKQSNLFRIDLNATSKLRLFFRGMYWREGNQGYNVGGAATTWDLIKSDARYDDNSGVFSGSYVLSPTLVQEFSVGAHHSNEATDPLNWADMRRLDRAALGITLPQFYPQFNPYNMIPWASFGGVPSAASINIDSRYPKQGADTAFTFSYGLSKVWSTHTAKTGLYAERLRGFLGHRGTFPGEFSFARDVNNPNDANWAYANAVLGNFTSYSESDARNGTQLRRGQVEWYVQDTWRVTRRFTLDYGMRFTTVVPPWSADGKAANWVPALYDPAQRVRFFEPAKNAQGVRVARNPLTGEFLPLVYLGAMVPGSGNPFNGTVLEGAAGFPKSFLKNRGIQWGPRLGFAYDVFGDGKTAIRGGGGIIYNNHPADSRLTRNPPSQSTPFIYYGNMSNYIASQGVLFPSDFSAIAGSGELPTIYSLSMGVQRDIGYGTVVDAAYVGTLGRHLQAERNLNSIPYGARFLPQNQDPTTGKALQDNFFRRYAGYAAMNYIENSTTSNYHSLQVQLNRRFSKGLQFGASWTWSKAMTYADGPGVTLASFVPVRIWNYGKAGYDRTHNLVLNWQWDVPKASRLRNTWMVRAAFDQWQISGFASFISGQPQGITMGQVDTTDITGGGDGIRVIVLSDPILPRSQRTPQRYFNTDVFARPPVGTYGNAPIDVFRGPGINNWDLSILKFFSIKEKVRLQFRWEFYNAFNHTQFSGVDSSTRFDLSGNQTNTRLGAVTSARDPRRMQGSLRFIF
jgi:hypothetical protein